MKTVLIAFISSFLFATFAGAVEPGVPVEAKPYIERASKEYSDGKYQDAAHDFSQAAKLSHDSCAICLEGLALSKAHLGDKKESFKLADTAISMAAAPGATAAAHDCKGQICLFYSASDPKELVDAEKEFRTSADLLPTRAGIQFRLGYVLLREKKDEEGIQHLQTFLAAEPAGANAVLARKFIANPRRARELYAPDFSFTTVRGDTIDNAALEGKIILMDFWATWCGPCRESVPELKELIKRYGPDRLRVISISADGKEDQWREFIAKKHMDWDQYRDADESIRKAFSVHAFPTYIVLDREGVIVKRMEGLDRHDSLIYRLRDELDARLK